MDTKPPTPVLPNLAHLTVADGSHAPTPEQVAKENARRRGKRRKNWFLDQPEAHIPFLKEGGNPEEK